VRAEKKLSSAEETREGPISLNRRGADSSSFDPRAAPFRQGQALSDLAWLH